VINMQRLSTNISAGLRKRPCRIKTLHGSLSA
jgi:hypothetical protein